MSTIKDFFHGLILLIRFKLHWLPEEVEKMMKQRNAICNECPLKDGIYCTKYKAVKIVDHNPLQDAPKLIYISSSVQDYLGRFMYKGATYIKGCGCVIALKTFLKQQKCPLNKW